MVKRLSFIAVLAVVAAASSLASAGIIVSGDVANTMNPGLNNFIGNLNPLYGGAAQVRSATLSTDQAGTLFFSFHASESGYINTFSFTKPDATVVSYTENPDMNWNAAGVSFGSVTGTVAELNSVLASLKFTSNHGLNAGIGQQGFGIYGTGGQVVASTDSLGRYYFGYDDNGAGPDDNHDDMIVSMEFVPSSGGPNVPEPATLSIWGLGLGIAGLVRLRRKS
jgi:hypothetical protein